MMSYEMRTPWKSKFPDHVCQVFVESGTRDLNAILHAAQQHDHAALLARLHSLKGALLVLGETFLADQCMGLEKRVETGAIDDAHANMGGFESDMRDVLERYAEACGMNR